MGVAAILDLALGMPFGGQMVWDIMLIFAADWSSTWESTA